jgi:predicted nucleic acid-binding protein
MKYVVDTNVLLRWSDADDPRYAECVAAVDDLIDRGIDVCICAQVLIEYWVTSTRPREVNGFGLSAAETESNLADVDGVFSLLLEPSDMAARWRRLATKHSVQGRQAHDARIAALMLAHGVTHILTLNADDFVRYDGITPVTPQEIAHH